MTILGKILVFFVLLFSLAALQLLAVDVGAALWGIIHPVFDVAGSLLFNLFVLIGTPLQFQQVFERKAELIDLLGEGGGLLLQGSQDQIFH